jgi:hypothetical protein
MDGALSRFNSFAKLIHGHSECVGEPNNYFDSWISNSALNTAEVGAVKVGFFGQFILRELGFAAEAGDVTPELGQ